MSRRRRKPRIRYLVLVLALTGCGKYWAPPQGRSQGRAIEEYNRCKSIAAQMTSASAPGNVFITNDQLSDCLKAYGWEALKSKPDDRLSVKIKT